MRYLVTGEEMQRYDENTSYQFAMEPLVLMERAALATVSVIMKEVCEIDYDTDYHGGDRLRLPSQKRNHRILVVAGNGNNGGDGLAVGRLLALAGFAVTFVRIGKEEPKSREVRHQIDILQKYGFPIQSKIPNGEYYIIIDALLGIGVTRPLVGEQAAAVTVIGRLRTAGARVVSLDIPSGIHAGNGRVQGIAVRADHTVTYGFAKRGHFLYPGADHTGKLIITDVGITPHSFLEQKPELFTYHGMADLKLPPRREAGHKGTFGKVVLIAGQRHMAGACALAGQAILRVGAGMVKVITHESNRSSLQVILPEAMVITYDNDRYDNDCCDKDGYDSGGCDNDRYDNLPEQLSEEVEAALTWADCTVIGPGMGQSAVAKELLRRVLSAGTGPVVADADAINLLGQEEPLRRLLMRATGRVTLTPHLGEFARLAHCPVTETGADDLDRVRAVAEELNCLIVRKDARTYICESGRIEGYLNTSGNSGMATAGSGDVLAGMIGGLLAQGLERFPAACQAVHLHGLAGDLAALEKTEYGVIASDIIAAIPVILKKAEER